MRVRMKFEPRDLWVGLFWKRQRQRFETYWNVYVCLLPMVVVHFAWMREHDRDQSPRRRDSDGA